MAERQSYIDHDARRTTARNGWMDILRAWAAFSVILLHLNIRVPSSDTALGAWLPGPLYRALVSSGFHGVRTFFVLSGFLIMTRTLARWGSPEQIVPSQFYRMRFARIAPCLLLFIVAQSALELLGVPVFSSAATRPTHLGTAILSALTFNFNWLEARYGYQPGAWDVLWSLSVEEAFYLGFPLACILTRSRRWLTPLLGVFVVVGPIVRAQLSNDEPWQDYSYLACMDGMAWGCLAALWVKPNRASRHRWLALSLGACAFLTALVFRRNLFDAGLTQRGLDVTLLSAGVALMLVALQENPSYDASSRLPVLRSIARFGQNSYEVYLMHMFVVLPLVALYQLAGKPVVLILPLYVVTVVSCAVGASWLARHFSSPLNRWLRSPREVCGQNAVVPRAGLD